MVDDVDLLLVGSRLGARLEVRLGGVVAELDSEFTIRSRASDFSSSSHKPFDVIWSLALSFTMSVSNSLSGVFKNTFWVCCEIEVLGCIMSLLIFTFNL